MHLLSWMLFQKQNLPALRRRTSSTTEAQAGQWQGSFLCLRLHRNPESASDLGLQFWRVGADSTGRKRDDVATLSNDRDADAVRADAGIGAEPGSYVCSPDAVRLCARCAIPVSPRKLEAKVVALPRRRSHLLPGARHAARSDSICHLRAEVSRLDFSSVEFALTRLGYSVVRLPQAFPEQPGGRYHRNLRTDRADRARDLLLSEIPGSRSACNATREPARKSAPAIVEEPTATPLSL